MKTKSFKLAGLAIALASPVFGIEAPADDTPPPPAVKQAPATPDTTKLPDIKLSKVKKPEAKATAFLGVISGEVPDLLSDHLGLKEGEGVVVRSVVPGGPAAQAGIALNDVITKVAGQPVGSPESISKEVSSHKPGDTVSLDLIHKGKPSKLDVILGSKPAELARLEIQPMPHLDQLEAMPKELADRVRDAIAGNVGGLDLQNGGPDLDQLPLGMKDAVQEMHKRLRGAMEEAFEEPKNPAPAGEQIVQNEATVRVKDNEGSVEVKSKNGAKEVTVRDHQENVVWSGPWDTPQDKIAAPATVRQRVDGLNLDSNFKGPGLRLRIGQAALPEE